jgi:hypothetical protein
MPEALKAFTDVNSAIGRSPGSWRVALRVVRAQKSDAGRQPRDVPATGWVGRSDWIGAGLPRPSDVDRLGRHLRLDTMQQLQQLQLKHERDKGGHFAAVFCVFLREGFAHPALFVA